MYLLDSFGEPTQLIKKNHLWSEKINLCMHESDQWIIGCDEVKHIHLITVFTFSSHPNKQSNPELYSTFMAFPGVNHHIHLKSYKDATSAYQGHLKWLYQLQAKKLTLNNLSLIND